MQMKSVAIILNPEKSEAVKLAGLVVPWLHERGVTVIAEHDAATVMSSPSLSRDEEQLGKADFALVMGGDGTLLRASRIMAPACVPMLAVRFGKFGFIMDTEPADVFSALERVLAGEYQIHERMMISATVLRAGEHTHTEPALNDIVIAKGPLARMLRLGTHVSGQYISTYAADGLIVATPTGSTAYSLSAGGPIIHPLVPAFVLTPICPHTLSFRPLAVPSTSTVSVRLLTGGEEVHLTLDGQRGGVLVGNDVIDIRKSPVELQLVTSPRRNYYDLVKEKLGWAE